MASGKTTAIVLNLIALLQGSLGSQSRWAKSSYHPGRADAHRNTSRRSRVVHTWISDHGVCNSVLEIHNSKAHTVRQLAGREVPTHTMSRGIVAIRERLIRRTERTGVSIPFIREAVE